jgi:hypothetical protein
VSSSCCCCSETGLQHLPCQAADVASASSRVHVLMSTEHLGRVWHENTLTASSLMLHVYMSLAETLPKQEPRQPPLSNCSSLTEAAIYSHIIQVCRSCCF